MGVVSVQFLLEDGTVIENFSSTPYTAPLDTTTLTNGFHTVTVTAFDAAGNSGSLDLLIDVDNIVTPPPNQDPLRSFSDEFDSASLLSNWDIHTDGPLASNYYEVLDIDETIPGHLTLTPGPNHSAWYASIMGPAVTKMITGNFVVTGYFIANNKNNLGTAPTSDFNAVGLIARNPDTPTRQNYVIANVGHQSYSNGVGTESKNTVNSSSNLFLDPDSNEAEMRICRIGNVFYTYKRNPTDSAFVQLDQFTRNDLPPTLQLGIMANGWDPSNNRAPDIRGEVDYIRYATPTGQSDCTMEIPPVY